MKLKDLKKLMREYSNSSDQDEFDVIIVNDVFSLSKTGQLNVTIVNDQKVEIHHGQLNICIALHYLLKARFDSFYPFLDKIYRIWSSLCFQNQKVYSV